MSSTATGFSYIPKSNGGLGVSRFEHIVKLGTLRSAIKIKNSLDPATTSLIDERYDKKLKSIANSLRLNWLFTIEDIHRKSQDETEKTPHKTMIRT